MITRLLLRTKVKYIVYSCSSAWLELIVNFSWNEFCAENETKDTKADVVAEVTFSPALRSFEMDVAESMGIKEGPTPFRTFWY